ncbi:hypothetical protein J1N35_009787 [Gossypium stocksii]|uniref:CCHC-type domain-containing protein n=1 Tax=Gossypium stocksii TaxID=47602 RepID=A0A9D4AB79_9ROSI|nr:hypothetical protein J1N35_009787 [Gossypium stocksii]
MAWIRLPGLPGYLYKRQIIEAISRLIGKEVKLDLQTDNRTWGWLARLAVFINLDNPLTSKVLVDGVIQRVEYEALPTVCFNCGKYGHVKELCPSVGVKVALERPATEENGFTNLKEGETHASGLMEVQRDGPSEKRIGPNVSLSFNRGRGSVNKGGNNRGRVSLNRSFKEKGGRLKNVGISRILLTEAISSVVNLVNSQVGSGTKMIGGSAEG